MSRLFRFRRVLTAFSRDGWDCAALFVLIFVIGAIAAAVVSVAALVDPFSWLPAVGETWADCEDKLDTPGGDCGLHTRFPGFWGHVGANFAYLVVAVGLLAWLASTVIELRAARTARFSGQAAVERHGHSRKALALAAILTGILGALPIIVAVA